MVKMKDGVDHETAKQKEIRLSILDAVTHKGKLYEKYGTYLNSAGTKIISRTILDSEGINLFQWRDSTYKPDATKSHYVSPKTIRGERRPITYTQAMTLLDLHWERRRLVDANREMKGREHGPDREPKNRG